MADNEQNNNNDDEYLFGDPDALTPDNEPTEFKPEEQKSFELPMMEKKNNMRRNAIIAVATVVVLVIVYNLFGGKDVYKEKKSATNTQVTQPTAIQPVAVASPVQSQPIVTNPTPTVSNSAIDDKLKTVESTQDTLQTEVGALNNQVAGMDNNVNTLMAKMTELGLVITQLNEKLDMQARVIERLTAHVKPARSHLFPTRFDGSLNQKIKYYVQAVIPGRAWLIATNGATLTVREGTTIKGYGVVKLIDPTQGRVMTSSGRVIRFSQDDS